MSEGLLGAVANFQQRQPVAVALALARDRKYIRWKNQ